MNRLAMNRSIHYDLVLVTYYRVHDYGYFMVIHALTVTAVNRYKLTQITVIQPMHNS